MPISNIKVLLLNVNREGWHSGNMIYDMEAVKAACDTKVYGPGWPDYKHTDIREIINQLYGNDQPDVIYSYFTPNERVGDVYMQHYDISESLRNFPTHFQDVNGPIKIFALSDFWARKPERFSIDLDNSSFQYCFCFAAPPYSNPKHFFSFFDDQLRKNIEFVGYPRCVDRNCYKDYGLPKEQDVITVGAMHNFYPLRVNMHRQLQANSAQLGIKYKNYSHCGVNFSHSDFVREKYAQAINRSKMLASCGGRYHLAFNKIFESMGCGTMYVGEKPYGEKELHFEDGYNYVAVTNDNFVEKVQYYLNNENEMNSIIQNAKDTFEKYHHIDARAKDFVDLLGEII